MNTVAPAKIQYTITAGTITIAEYISPIRYTVISLAARILLTGIGIDRSRSLSFDRYKPEYVLKILPNAPIAIAINAMIRKKSHPRSTATKPAHRLMDK